jgi:hypothetical protein
LLAKLQSGEESDRTHLAKRNAGNSWSLGRILYN